MTNANSSVFRLKGKASHPVIATFELWLVDDGLDDRDLRRVLITAEIIYVEEWASLQAALGK